MVKLARVQSGKQQCLRSLKSKKSKVVTAFRRRSTETLAMCSRFRLFAKIGGEVMDAEGMSMVMCQKRPPFQTAK
jgi:hypothetical protein